MAKVSNLLILNSENACLPICAGRGVIEDADDVLVTDNERYGVGALYTNIDTGKMYVRKSISASVSSWSEI